MRGVPRQRPAISARASRSTSRSSSVAARVEHLLELALVVELEVRGESEPVAQRIRQQSGSGRGADEGERRQIERDGCRASALADHDVDAEVLHRQVQHLFGRPRHPVDLVDEEHLARHERRQHRRQVAGVLDGRTARHAQRTAALVRDDHRERGLAESGRTGEQDVVGRAVLHRRRLQQQLELPAHLRLTDELGERARAQRALEGELGLGLGFRAVEVVAIVGHGHGLPRAAGRAEAGEREPQQGWTLSRSFCVGCSATTSSTACAATFSGQPRPTSATSTLSPIDDGAPPRPGDRRPRVDRELAGQRDHDELRGLRARCRTPCGTPRRRRPRPPRAIWPGVSTASTPIADFGPTPVTPGSSVEHLAVRRRRRIRTG